MKNPKPIVKIAPTGSAAGADGAATSSAGVPKPVVKRGSDLGERERRELRDRVARALLAVPADTYSAPVLIPTRESCSGYARCWKVTEKGVAYLVAKGLKA